MTGLWTRAPREWLAQNSETRWLWTHRCTTGGQLRHSRGQPATICGHQNYSKILLELLLPGRLCGSTNHTRHRARRLAPGGLRSGRTKGNRSRGAKVGLSEGVARRRQFDSAGGNSGGGGPKQVRCVSSSKTATGRLARADHVRVPPTHTWRGPHTHVRLLFPSCRGRDTQCRPQAG